MPLTAYNCLLLVWLIYLKFQLLHTSLIYTEKDKLSNLLQEHLDLLIRTLLDYTQKKTLDHDKLRTPAAKTHHSPRRLAVREKTDFTHEHYHHTPGGLLTPLGYANITLVDQSINSNISETIISQPDPLLMILGSTMDKPERNSKSKDMALDSWVGA